MPNIVPLDQLPPEARRLIRPGTPAFNNYAQQFETDNKLPKGSIVHAKLNLKDGSDPLSVFNAIKTAAPHINLAPLTADPTEGMSWIEKALVGNTKSFMDTGRGIGQRLGMVSQADVDEARKLDAPLMSTGAGMLGNVVGTVGQTMLPGAGLAKAMGATKALAYGGLPLLRSLLNPVVQGAAVGAGYNALQPTSSDESTLGNVAQGGVAGAAGSALGAGVQALGSAAIDSATPAVAKLAQKAADMGLNLRAGQISNNSFTKWGTKLTDLIPFLNNTKALSDTQRTQLSTALSKTVGEDTPDALAAVQGAKKRLSPQFDAMNVANDVQVEPWHVDQLNHIYDEFKRGATTPEDYSLVKRLGSIRDNIVNHTDNNGVIDGPLYQKIRTSLGDAASGTDATTGYRQAVDDTKGVLDQAFDSGLSPTDLAAKNSLREQWGNMKLLQQAVPTAEGGEFDLKKVASLVRADKASRAAYLGGRPDALNDVAQVGNQFVLGKEGTSLSTADTLANLAKKSIGPAAVGASMFGLHHDEPHPILESAEDLGGLALASLVLGRGANSQWFSKGVPLIKGLGSAMLAGNQAPTGALNAMKDSMGVPSGFTESPTGNGVPYMEIHGTGSDGQ